MLIRLKSLILHRAKVLGHDELAKNFDLPTLRAIGIFSALSLSLSPPSLIVI